PNPKLNIENTPFYVIAQTKTWENDEYPLRAGVSAFGIGGTNAHVILEEPPPQKRETCDTTVGKPSLIILSAKSGAALERTAAQMTAFLENNPATDLNDVAYTLMVGRAAMECRRMTVCTSVKEAAKLFSQPDSARVHSHVAGKEEPPVVFMFSGQGSQYVNMGLELYRKETQFREEVDKCYGILDTLGCSIKGMLYPDEADSYISQDEAKEKMNDVLYSGPIKFTMEYAFAQLLLKWGIKPYAMIGHSFGEYAVAQIAGVFSLEDALTLVVLRGRLMQKTAPGAMMSVPIPEHELKPLLNDQLSLAAVNSPSLCIVSGPTAEMDAFEKELTQKGHECLRINFPRASHSKMMETILEEFEKGVRKIRLNKPEIPYISGMTGKWIAVDEVTQPGYWSRHLTNTVRFSDGLQTLLEQPDVILVQMSSDRGLPLFASLHPGLKPQNLILNLARHHKEKESDVDYILEKLGMLWLRGVTVDWTQLYRQEKGYRISLPGYPFQREAFTSQGDPFSVAMNLLSGDTRIQPKQKKLENWFYIPSWMRTRSLDDKSIKKEAVEKGKWLLFEDRQSFGCNLARELEKAGHSVIRVVEGKEFSRESDSLYTIAPAQKKDYERLLDEIYTYGDGIDHILHMWSVDGGRQYEKTGMEDIDNVLEKGYYSLVLLAQVIGDREVDRTLQMVIFTDNLHDVTGEEEINPAKALVIGAVRTIPTEYANIRCRGIDIQLQPAGSHREQRLLEQLSADLRYPSTDPVIAYRGNYRWVQTVKPSLFKETGKKHLRLKKRGVYLVTGGLGGVGLALAKYLASRQQARLVLVGRSPLPEKESWDRYLENQKEDDDKARKIKEVRELEKHGAEVLVFSADTSVTEQMEEVVVQTEKTFGPIDGVIHSAGVPAAGVIQLKTREIVEASFAAKVRGTLILDNLFSDGQLDFFLLCSSLNSVLPALAHMDYCAANAFMDSFAIYNNFRNKTFTVSINWDRWKNIGMAVNAGAKHKELTGEELPGMTGEEGAEAFARILEDSLPHVFVSVTDLANLLEQMDTGEAAHRQQPEETRNEMNTKEFKRRKRPELSTPYKSPLSDIEEKLAETWAEFFGYQQVGICDDFFQLGGD
ncbi:MAG: SDR family NAD(P)-dependent oxidoreductase, partial [bacterium]|nr:SDR family NAD(P)-dependent oxidoreductase [bacterium]